MTEALHMKWPVKIHNSKQWDFKIQKELVAWKSLMIAAKLKNIFQLLGSPRVATKTNCDSVAIYSHFKNSAP